MSILTTIFKTGFGSIPVLYKVGAIVVIVGALFIWSKVYFDNKVDQQVAVEINAYIATKVKEDSELAAITLKDSSQVKIKLITDKQTITQVVTKTIPVIVYVPEAKNEVSTGLVNFYNDSVIGKVPDIKSIEDKSPSGIKVEDILAVVSDNNGACLETRAQLIAAQDWITKTKVDVDAFNKKHGAKK